MPTCGGPGAGRPGKEEPPDASPSLDTGRQYGPRDAQPALGKVGLCAGDEEPVPQCKLRLFLGRPHQERRRPTIQHFWVGHTKNDVDQRFSILASALNKQAVLETPEDRGCYNPAGKQAVLEMSGHWETEADSAPESLGPESDPNVRYCFTESRALHPFLPFGCVPCKLY